MQHSTYSPAHPITARPGRAHLHTLPLTSTPPVPSQQLPPILSYVAALMWMVPGLAVDSILLAVLTESPAGRYVHTWQPAQVKWWSHYCVIKGKDVLAVGLRRPQLVQCSGTKNYSRPSIHVAAWLTSGRWDAHLYVCATTRP